jgi:hypothetical protein
MPGVCENFGSGSNNAPAWIGSIVKPGGLFSTIAPWILMADVRIDFKARQEVPK